MKKLFIFSVFALAILVANAQTAFQRVYPNCSYFQSVQQTTEGGYIVAGYQSSSAYLLKLDANANPMWSKSYDGDGSRSFASVKQTNDGGYIAVGNFTPSGSSNIKIYLVRTDANGDTLWTKLYGGTLSDQAISVKQTPDGGFILAGSTTSYGTGNTNAYIIKTDANGNIAWTKTFASPGAVNTESCNEIQNTSDGGFILTGTSGYTSNHEILVIKLNSVGDTLWTRIFYQFYSSINDTSSHVGKSVIQTSDGGYMVLGNLVVGGGLLESGQAVMIKLNSAGDITWRNTFFFSAGIMSNTNYLNSIRQAPDGGYLFAGSATQGSGLFTTDDAVLIKTDMNGAILWTKRFASNSYLYDIALTNDGGFIVAGNTSSWGGGAYLIKTDSIGNAACDQGPVSVTTGSSAITIFKGATLGSGGLVSGIPATVGIIDTTHTNPCLPVPSICMVTIDTVSQKNMVIWEKNIDTTYVDSYNIYRETSYTNVYENIGNVANNSFSTFIDYTSNPLQKANRYKISAVDEYGVESYTKSAVHRTIHLAVDLGTPPLVNLSWNAYEGFTANTFKIWRGNTSGMFPLDSVDGNTFAYTDLNPPSSDSLYFIEAPKPNGNCNPTLKSYSSSKSNFLNVNNPAGIGIIEFLSNTGFSISPNPSNNIITIETTDITKQTISIYNMQGQLLIQQPMPQAKTVIDISSLEKGLYVFKLSNANGIAVKKFIKE